MSGILCAMAGSAVSVPVQPLDISIILNGGDTYSSGGSNSDLYSNYGSVMTTGAGATGGVPPYTYSGPTLTVDAISGGSCFIMTASDGVHQTIGWSGLPPGGTILFHLDISVTDSKNNTASSRYPVSGSVVVHQ